MLAKETDTPFSDKEWIYEIKWDGYRAIAEVKKSTVSLYSRNGNTFNNSYPSVVQALTKMNLDAVLDGEVIVTDADGKSNFQLLQHYEESYPLEYRVFDILFLNGKNLCELPLLERKKILQKLLKKNDIVKYSEHIEKKGEDFFAVAKENNLEGIMAKKADSTYTPGLRTSDWLKIKHHKSQEAIIAGFTEPTGARNHFGALVLGIKKGNKLVYAGHTGSGFTEKGLKEMSQLLKPLIQKNSPFDEQVKTNMPVTWVKPILVCEIKFTEITSDGKMRHPIFLRLREDKKANEVTMENTKTVKAKKPVESVAKEKKIKAETNKQKKVSLAEKTKPEKPITKKKAGGKRKRK